jgi:hypothetical protein
VRAGVGDILLWLKWAFKSFPDWRRRGRFSGEIGLNWRGPLNYHFRNDKGFVFERGMHPDEFKPTGEIIVPGEMDTDGGSIPRFAWILPRLDPWTYMPAYLIHDWEFQAHHNKESNKTFEEVNATLVEAVYTLMVAGVTDYSGFDLRLIYDGVSSPLGRAVWDGTRKIGS